jgi:hypothetical protein
MDDDLADEPSEAVGLARLDHVLLAVCELTEACLDLLPKYRRFSGASIPASLISCWRR